MFYTVDMLLSDKRHDLDRQFVLHRINVSSSYGRRNFFICFIFLLIDLFHTNYDLLFLLIYHSSVSFLSVMEYNSVTVCVSLQELYFLMFNICFGFILFCLMHCLRPSNIFHRGVQYSQLIFENSVSHPAMVGRDSKKAASSQNCLSFYQIVFPTYTSL